MSVFAYEIASVMAAVARVHPGHQKGIYALPWYLVAGEPGSGRTAIVQSMNLTWPHGTSPVPISTPQQLCTYWMSGEAVFIEPEQRVLGPGRDPQLLQSLCDELRQKRVREPLDGILLVISIAAIIDLEERPLEAYANALRTYLVEVGRAIKADVPVYVALTRYDTLWGFGEVFQWTAERKGEEPWGFVLPGDTESQSSVARINAELDGLAARFEAFCLAKLSSEDPPEHRCRAFQHLAEVRALMTKVRTVLGVIAMASSYERAPWMRALIVGCAVPGTGERIRAGAARFSNMGLFQGQDGGPRLQRPGGLPLHAFMRAVVLPEKELVPTRVRWRDDKLTVICFALGLVLWLGYLVATIVVAATA